MPNDDLPPGFKPVEKPPTDTSLPPGFRSGGQTQTDPDQSPVPLQGGGATGTLARGTGGYIQGLIDPLQGLGSYLGIPRPSALEKPLSRTERVAQTPAGEVGRLAGNVLNPAWALLGPIKGIELVSKYGPAGLRALQELAQRALQGGIAGGVMPGENRGEQAGIGATAAAALGLPRAAAILTGYPSISAMISAGEKHIPVLRNLFSAFRSLSIPDFNRVWNDYVLKPIKGTTPPAAGHDANAAVQDQIGKAIDTATRNATFDDSLANHIVRDDIENRARTGMGELGEREYKRIVDQYFDKPLAENSGRLQTSQLLKAQSDIEAQARLMPQATPEQRAVRRALSEFRMWVLDNATMTADERAAYSNAREAYKRYAISREAIRPTGPEGRFGMFTPDGLMTELDERYPYQVPVGRAPYQSIAGTAQQALGFPGRAAARTVAGQPPLQILPPSLAIGVPAATARGVGQLDRRRQ